MTDHFLSELHQLSVRQLGEGLAAFQLRGGGGGAEAAPR